MAEISKVWIEEEECIACEACVDAAPDVLEMDGDMCKVQDQAKSPDFCKEHSDQVEAAADACPVGAVKSE